MVPEPEARYAHQVADVVLPDVEPDDHQDLADDADDDQREPGPARRGRAGVLGMHVAHQPYGEYAEAVADRARRAADESLEQRAAGQQRRRQREPHEDQARERCRRMCSGEATMASWLAVPAAAVRLPSTLSFRRCRSPTQINGGVKFGGRFSVNAFMPSVWSSVAKARSGMRHQQSVPQNVDRSTWAL